MKYNEDLCSQVREGKLAIENTDKGKLEDLIHHIFQRDHSKINGKYNYYFKDVFSYTLWDCFDATPLPSLPVSDFYLVEKEGEKPKYITKPVDTRTPIERERDLINRIMQLERRVDYLEKHLKIDQI